MVSVPAPDGSMSLGKDSRGGDGKTEFHKTTDLDRTWRSLPKELWRLS